VSESVVYPLEVVHVHHHHHGGRFVVVPPAPRGRRLFGLGYHLFQLGAVEEPGERIVRLR
jgi:hypothetical protein